jgi:hypothetical protein
VFHSICLAAIFNWVSRREHRTQFIFRLCESAFELLIAVGFSCARNIFSIFRSLRRFPPRRTSASSGLEIIYFKLYKSQIPVVEQALEMVALMPGSGKSRSYCLEMICADFLAERLRTKINRKCWSCLWKDFTRSCPTSVGINYSLG